MTEVPPLLVLQARAEALAILYDNGALDIEIALAVAALRQYARENAIADKVSEAIIKAAFAEAADP